MALQITSRVVDGVAVESLDGSIVFGEESAAVRAKLKSLLDAGHKKIVVNMKNVTYVDSSGLGALIASNTGAQKAGGSLKLSNIGSKFLEILEMTRLSTVLEFYDDEAAAIASFSK